MLKWYIVYYFIVWLQKISISPQWKVIGNSKGVGSLKRQNIKGKHAISGGVEVKTKKPFVGGKDISWNNS